MDIYSEKLDVVIRVRDEDANKFKSAGFSQTKKSLRPGKCRSFFKTGKSGIVQVIANCDDVDVLVSGLGFVTNPDRLKKKAEASKSNDNSHSNS